MICSFEHIEMTYHEHLVFIKLLFRIFNQNEEKTNSIFEPL